MNENELIPAAIFVRVSADHQKYESQIAELQKVAKQKGCTVVETIAVKQSTDKERKHKKERHDLDRLRELAESGKIKKVFIWGVSRFGRNNYENHTVLQQLIEHNVSLYVHHYGMETLLPNGRKNPMASWMFLFYGEQAENENEERRASIVRGMQYARNEGKHIGRKKGSSKSEEDLLSKYAKVVRQLKEGHNSIREIARICEVTPPTVMKVKKALQSLSVPA